jgi:hypothetical protein
MKKLLLVIFLFLSFHMLSYAPDNTGVIYIPTIHPINYIDKLKVEYKPLIEAIGIIESNKNNESVNKKEGAYGYFQIRHCKLKDYNKLTGKNYSLQDMHDFDKALEVFLYFVNHNSRGKLIPDKSYELTAKNWNGSGPMTEKYWQKVQAQLNKGQRV